MLPDSPPLQSLPGPQTLPPSQGPEQGPSLFDIQVNVLVPPPHTHTLTMLTVWPHPAQGAGTAAIGSMTQAPIPAGTLEFTALAKPVLGTA